MKIDWLLEKELCQILEKYLAEISCPIFFVQVIPQVLKLYFIDKLILLAIRIRNMLLVITDFLKDFNNLLTDFYTIFLLITDSSWNETKLNVYIR